MKIEITINNQFDIDENPRSVLVVQHSSMKAKIIRCGRKKPFEFADDNDFFTIYFYRNGGDPQKNPFDYIYGYDKAVDDKNYVKAFLPPGITPADITDPTYPTFIKYRIDKNVPPIWKIEVENPGGFAVQKDSKGKKILTNGNVTVGDADQ